MSFGLRILAAVTDAYGGRGGIAQYNRHLFNAICKDTRVERLVVLPRLVPNAPEDLPPNLQYIVAAAGSWMKYALQIFRQVLRAGSFDIVVCSHLNLLPLAALAACRFRAKLVLIIYGVEAWKPPERRINSWLLRYVDEICSISEFTRDRMQSWYTRLPPTFLLPNAFDPAIFSPGPRPDYLISRYKLDGKRVLLILGRMSPEERLKGFDEMLAAAPELFRIIPDLALVLAGDGADRPRLEQLARNLGIADRVVFTGYIPEPEKPDLYRLADVFILPSRQEGFGFVLIEAMACGIPSIGSSADGSREAMLNGRLGPVIDPCRPQQIVDAVRDSIRQPRRVPAELAYFSLEQFERRVSDALTRLSVRTQAATPA
jgi:phosphatidyl-myo-inositol dimannoside synthase